MKKLFQKIKNFVEVEPLSLEVQPLQKGFTLIETLVAVLIFSTSIVSLIVLTAGGVSNTNFVRSKLTAQYLGEEGIDLVRAVRDASLRYGNPQGITDLVSQCAPSNGGCTIEPLNENLDSNAIVSCGGECAPLMMTENSGIYTHDTVSDSTETQFTRTITVEDSAGELKIESKVDWSFGNNDFSVVNHEYLYPWIVQYTP
jgi:prepilin-type N-terminal cleavage/methylation domain-containing protein